MQGAEEEQEDAGPSCSSQAPGFVEAFIEVRIHKLQQRQFFLQKMQQVIQRAQDTQHDDGDVSELELVEKELEELMRQKQSLIPQSPLYTGHVTLSPVIYNAENDGGVYTLPPLHFIPTAPPQLEEQDTPEPSPPSEEAVPPEPHIEVNLQEKDGMQIISAECLGQDGAFTMCPSCEQVVFTQTKKINGESVWIMSCIVAVVGLCFIAFCLDQLKSVRHKCPQCRSTIHTFHPF